MPYKRRSHFSGHFLSPDFGAFHVKLDFFNTHSPITLKMLRAGISECVIANHFAVSSASSIGPPSVLLIAARRPVVAIQSRS